MSAPAAQSQKSISRVFKHGLFGAGVKKAATGLALTFALAASPAMAGTNGQITAVRGNADFYAQVIRPSGATLVEFYADWCGYCKAMKPLVMEAARENPQLNVVVVNVDDPANAELTRAFASKGIPAFIVAKDGKPVTHASGAFSSPRAFGNWLGYSLSK